MHNGCTGHRRGQPRGLPSAILSRSVYDPHRLDMIVRPLYGDPRKRRSPARPDAAPNPATGGSMATGPTFRHPPVVEVALGVQFEPIDGLRIADLARYWEQVRGRLPDWSQHPRLPHVAEVFGPPGSSTAQIGIELGPPMVRAGRSWFSSEDGQCLQQVQDDRFVCNWRRYQDPTATYPRYKTHHRPQFFSDLDDFEKFVAERDLGPIQPDHVEVTYVNHVFGGAVTGDHSELHRVLEVFSDPKGSDHPGLPENVDLAMRYRIDGEDGRPRGRLHVVTKPVFRRSDLSPMYAVTLTARLGLERGDRQELESELDRGHDFLVEAFRTLTKSEMHEAWGLSNE